MFLNRYRREKNLREFIKGLSSKKEKPKILWIYVQTLRFGAFCLSEAGFYPKIVKTA